MLDSKTFITSFFIDLLITIFFYLSIPLISKFILKKDFNEKTAKKFIITNCIIVYIILTIIQISINSTVANFAPAILWGYIGYSIIKPKYEKKEN